jgi:hypothetical protein
LRGLPEIIPISRPMNTEAFALPPRVLPRKQAAMSAMRTSPPDSRIALVKSTNKKTNVAVTPMGIPYMPSVDRYRKVDIQSQFIPP